MNDRFKFRVWLPFEKRMITTDNESFFALNQHGSLLKINDKNEAFFARIGHTFSKENIMQCTGLKDKNGKLLFEGDVVNQNNTIYSVNWCDGSFCFKDALNGKNYTVEFVMSAKLEVIGNIYQDKELLNESR